MSETTHSSATVRSLIGMLTVVCVVATIDRWVRPLPFPPKSEGLVVALPQSGGGATSQPSAADLEKAVVEAVEAYIKSPLVVVFDANSEAGYKEARIPGAIHLPPDAFSGDVPAAVDRVSRSSELLVYCKSSECEAAEYVILRLKELGYTNVRLFKGGIRAWIAAGKPVEKG